MTKENKTSETTAQCAIQNVNTRTFLFSGWYAGAKFEMPIKADDRETAIAYFETDYPNHRWYQTEDI
jgi:hypothetical protein